ncbi:MAG: carbonic anhydrase [Patescibacteria group bacterium]
MQQYPFKNFHHVPVAAIYCLDPRFRTQHEQFISRELGFEEFDQYVFPGGPKALVSEPTRNVFLEALKNVSINLHHIEKIILIAHRDCGAYGGSVAFPDLATEEATQIKDLQTVRDILLEQFPKISVSMFYAEIIGENIEFNPVE